MKERKKGRGLLIAVIILIVSALIALGTWYAFGNQLTLHLHAKEVTQTINAGSLDIPGANSNDYDEFPDFVKEMLGQEEKKETAAETGPLLNAILPYVNAECTKIHGFFGGTTVEYTITAPDVESWLLGLDAENVESAEDLLEQMKDYLPGAPDRTRTVTIEYTRSGFFKADWEGMYLIPEFTDAVSGGVNSAYSELYQKMLEQMKEAIQ